MILRPILDRWRLCALLTSAAMLAVAHAFQHFGGYAPCALCLRQREVYWAAGALAAVAMVLVRLPGGPRLREPSCWLLALIFLVGAAIATYHAGAEWKFWPGPATCSGVSKGVTAESMAELLNGASYRPPACDHAPWVMAGLSMAGWNVLASLGLAAVSVLAARRERTKR